MTAGAIPPVSAVAAGGTAAGTGSVLAGSVGGITAVVGVESTLAGSVAGAYLNVSIPFSLCSFRSNIPAAKTAGLMASVAGAVTSGLVSGLVSSSTGAVAGAGAGSAIIHC